MEGDVIRRRDLVIGGLCLASAGTAYAVTPRKRISLVGDAQLEDVLPRTFGPWVSRDVSDALALNSPDSLAAKLYNQLVTRAYSNLETGRELVMLVAYGQEQTDGLQLHRPEVCYPAFGYDIVRNEPTQVVLGTAVSLPARRLAATAQGRHESILYWSRIGEALPRDGDEQRRDRLRIAMQGVIPDGILVRFSAADLEPGEAWPDLAQFVRTLLSALPAAKRKILVGTNLGERLRGVLPTTQS
jgi:EpsI family protein